MKSSNPKPSPRKRQTAGELLELQRLMAGTVMQPLTQSGGMCPKRGDGCSMKKLASGFIKPNDRLTSFERLEIYNRQYWYRLKDCFYEDYIGLQAILGERRFERMAVAYLAECPSCSFTLRNLGRRLVQFLEANPRWIKPFEKPALDMARLEWAHIEAFDNEAKPRLHVDSVLGADPAAIHLKLQPHLTLLRLGYELDSLLIRLKRDEGLRQEASNAIQPGRTSTPRRLARHLRPMTIFLAVHRQDETVYYKRLKPAQFRVLSAIQSGTSLDEACESLAGAPEDEVAQVGKWFETWAGLGWFCELE
ncbi:MAG TPA: DNA-binding domain-containing protein [Candidatus Acidoferrales bacterium]|nr:DNA-binding domain-containing protein [Candidatus Acidoferrales bacterium]